MKKTYLLLFLLLFTLPSFANNMHFSLFYTGGPHLEISGHGTTGNLYIGGKKDTTVHLIKPGKTDLTATTTRNFSAGLIYILDTKGNSCTISYSKHRGNKIPPLKIIRTTLPSRCHISNDLILII